MDPYVASVRHPPGERAHLGQISIYLGFAQRGVQARIAKQQLWTHIKKQHRISLLKGAAASHANELVFGPRACAISASRSFQQ